MIQSYQETTDRNFVLYTGVEGARQMTSYIQRANDADYVKFLLEKGHVQSPVCSSNVRSASTGDMDFDGAGPGECGPAA